jgi:hypothetical protein
MNLFLSIVHLIYFLIILGYILMVIFIIYHLSKYSFYFSSKNFTLTFFMIASLSLLIINIGLYFSLDLPGIFKHLL